MIDPSRLKRTTPGTRVWRVGRRPAPWEWVDWKYASPETGTFPGRWDSPVPRTYRTIYAATFPQGALLEVLARFRPDPQVVAAMSAVDVDGADADLHSTVVAGVIPEEWFDERMLTSADLAGEYCDVAHSETIAALRPDYLAIAVDEFHQNDFDASVLQNALVRPLTQALSADLYALTVNDQAPAIEGIRFLSRFGADQELWTVFEQPADGTASRLINGEDSIDLHPDDLHVMAAFNTLGLTIDE